MPPLPTSSMSGSFQPPRCAWTARPTLALKMPSMLPQLSEMSPVVRQLLPTGWAQSHGAFAPHSQMENTIGLPVARRASRIRVYRSWALCPRWSPQLSYLR
jgi:hypothetical protein